jgi:hypothetical protein
MRIPTSHVPEENIIDCGREFIILAFSPSFVPNIIVESGEQV